MPRDRQGRRAVLLATGIVCLTISSGCLTSSFVRRTNDPAPPPSSTASSGSDDRRDAQNIALPGRTDSSVRNASVQPADESLAGASSATPFLRTPEATPSPPAGAFPIELQAAPAETTGNVAPGSAESKVPAGPVPAAEPAAPAVEVPGPASTPLLDAAIQRVADVTRQQREAIAASPDPIEDQRPARVSAPPPATRSPAPKPEPREEKKPAKKPAKTPDPPAPDRAPSSDLPSAIVAEVREPEHRAPLGISDLRLCQKVFGFGSFEPLAGKSVKVGQRLLVYCELTGLQYEARDEGFASRISSRVEVRPALGGPALWEQDLGAAEDRCRRQRRDYYVNYRVDLPKTLGPGSYTLRFLQTDLLAGSSTTMEIPLEIAP